MIPYGSRRDRCGEALALSTNVADKLLEFFCASDFHWSCPGPPQLSIALDLPDLETPILVCQPASLANSRGNIFSSLTVCYNKHTEASEIVLD